MNETFDISLTCKVTGFPVPTNIKWFFKTLYSPVTNSTNVNVIPEAVSDTEFTSKLVLRNVNISQDGVYYCSSGDGLHKQTVLTVKGKPRLTIDIVKAVTTSEIFVNWTLNQGNTNVTALKLYVCD